MERNQLPVCQFVNDPATPIRRYADKGLAMLTFAISQVAGHFVQNIADLAIKVTLRFQDGAPDQRIQSPANFRLPLFEAQA